MPKQSSKVSKDRSSKKLDPAITVALIALVGTLAAALFSSPVLLALIQRTPAPPAQTSLPSSSPVDSNNTVNTSLTPLVSIVTSGDENCLTQYFTDIDSAKLVSIEVGAYNQTVYLSSDELASKQFVGPFGVQINAEREIYWCIFFSLFPQ